MSTSDATEPGSETAETGRRLAADRVDYRRGALTEDGVGDDPLALFDRWLDDAFALREQLSAIAPDGLTLIEPTAMALTTTDASGPHTRTVLLKHRDERGFVFFTNQASAKARQVADQASVALLFWWTPLQRQVRVEGTATMAPREESEAYFATRPRGSQLGAWASPQSDVVADVDELASRYRLVEQRFDGLDVPCPPFWGGYVVEPRLLEFWQGRPSRMHDRLQWTRGDGGWSRARLAP